MLSAIEPNMLTFRKRSLGSGDRDRRCIITSHQILKSWFQQWPKGNLKSMIDNPWGGQSFTNMIQKTITRKNYDKGKGKTERCYRNEEEYTAQKVPMNATTFLPFLWSSFSFISLPISFREDFSVHHGHYVSLTMTNEHGKHSKKKKMVKRRWWRGWKRFLKFQSPLTSPTIYACQKSSGAIMRQLTLQQEP